MVTRCNWAVKARRGQAVALAFTALFAVGCLVTYARPAYAQLSQSQKDLFAEQIHYFNVEEDVCGSADAPSGTLSQNVPVAYRDLFTKAASAAKINPNYLAALFVTEHGNAWPNPAGPWATSPSGANGPFQFMPGTWDAYKTDGDGDGKTDVQNLADAAFSAAKLIVGNGGTSSTPLGNLTHPYTHTPLPFTYIAGAYNAGGGTMEQYTTPSSPVDAPGLSKETINYVKNVYYLVTTDFQHGNPSYGNALGTVIDNTGGAAGAPSPSGATTAGSCGVGAVQGSIVQTALNLAWDSSKPNQWRKADAKPSYQKTMPTVHGTDPPENYWSDCGRFVATVMRSSGVDKNYVLATTTSQRDYVKSHPELYDVMPASNTSQFAAGDILISSAHTYIYVGPQPDGSNSRSASWVGANEEFAGSPSSFVPSAYNANVAGDYIIARFKGGV